VRACNLHCLVWQVRFIVMNNVFQSALPLTKQYDLKGSTLGRTSRGEGAGAKSGRVLKDLDLDIKLKLEEGWHDRRALPCPCRAC
jgi:1-phosphatidylinositol-4-phosphate 5-kinase